MNASFYTSTIHHHLAEPHTILKGQWTRNRSEAAGAAKKEMSDLSAVLHSITCRLVCVVLKHTHKNQRLSTLTTTTHAKFLSFVQISPSPESVVVGRAREKGKL